MKKMIKYLKFLGIVILVLIGISGILFLNHFLKEERLFIYAKGTKEKAFLNATWKMSVREVERANNCNLTHEFNLFVIDPDLNKILDLNRFESKEGCEVNIWGNDREISYDFFDDQLFRVRIYDNILNKREVDSLIVTSLEQKYGKIKRDKENYFAGKFKSNTVEVDYKQWEYSDKENKIIKRFLIEITNIALIEEIKRISDKEQNEIF